jgi:hypothetical protein
MTPTYKYEAMRSNTPPLPLIFDRCVHLPDSIPTNIIDHSYLAFLLRRVPHPTASRLDRPTILRLHHPVSSAPTSHLRKPAQIVSIDTAPEA